jgi:hypothetical protein
MQIFGVRPLSDGSPYVVHVADVAPPPATFIEVDPAFWNPKEDAAGLLEMGATELYTADELLAPRGRRTGPLGPQEGERRAAAAGRASRVGARGRNRPRRPRGRGGRNRARAAR